MPGPGDPRYGRPLPPGRADERRGRADRRARGGPGRRRAPAAHPLAGRGQPADARLRPARRGHREAGRGRRKRILYLSSPIGLGHVERDVAIVEALAASGPASRSTGWPSTRSPRCSAAAANASTRPRGSSLAEAAHVDAEAGVHDLHAFQAIRRMDEILVANFMLFADLVENERYDLWVGDEAWELDHFLHENPGLKRAPYAWLTDFVGWLPMPAGGAAEAELTADYNAEMVEHIARWPRLRDRAIFVGNPSDLVEDPLGPDLPSVRDWTLSHFDFSGYIGPPLEAGRARGTALCRHRRRVGHRRGSAAPGGRGIPARPAGVARPADDRRGRAPDRPREPGRARGTRDPGVRGPPRPPPRTVRPRDHPRRAVHHDDADRAPPAVPLRAAAQPLRAEPARPAPARRVPGRAVSRLGGHRAGGAGGGDRRGDREAGLLPAGRDGRRREGRPRCWPS